MMMKDSADKASRKAYPEIKSGTKRSAVRAAQETECSLRIKDIIGIIQTNRAVLGSTSNKVFSKVGPKGKRDMVSEEVKMFEEEQRTATAVTQAKKCAWTKWNDIESIKLSWKFLIAMEPRAISFLLHSTFDRLPNVTYQKLWGYTNLDLCFSCKSDWGTLHHVLSSCPQSLLRYTCWHNKVSEVVIECEAGNQQPFPAKEPIIQFHKEGECSVMKQKIPIWSYWMELVTGKFQWISRHLYNFQFTLFKQKICSVVRFKEECSPHRIDCPLEKKTQEEAHERKKNWYETLRADCVEKGWICLVNPVDVGCHGFLGHSVISFLSKIGITGCCLKVASYLLQTTVQYASSWIWSRAKSLQHEWNERRITIPVWLRNIKKQLP